MSVTGKIEPGAALGKVLPFSRPGRPRGGRQPQQFNPTGFVVVNEFASDRGWSPNTLLVTEGASLASGEPAQATPPSKAYLYNYLAEMGAMYHSACEKGFSPRDLSGLEHNRILLVRMMNCGDPVEQALAAIAICSLVETYGMDGDGRIISAAEALNRLMSRLPVEAPAPIFVEPHEIEQLPDISEDAVYEPRSRHPAELAVHVLDKAFAAISAMDSPHAAMVSKAYSKAAEDLILLAFIEYGKLLGRIREDRPEREEVYRAAGINFRETKKHGITGSMRNYAGEMRALYPAPSMTFTGLLSSVAHRVGLGSFFKV